MNSHDKKISNRIKFLGFINRIYIRFKWFLSHRILIFVHIFVFLKLIICEDIHKIFIRYSFLQMFTIRSFICWSSHWACLSLFLPIFFFFFFFHLFIARTTFIDIVIYSLSLSTLFSSDDKSISNFAIF